MVRVHHSLEEGDLLHRIICRLECSCLEVQRDEPDDLFPFIPRILWFFKSYRYHHSLVMPPDHIKLLFTWGKRWTERTTKKMISVLGKYAAKDGVTVHRIVCLRLGKFRVYIWHYQYRPRHLAIYIVITEMEKPHLHCCGVVALHIMLLNCWIHGLRNFTKSPISSLGHSYYWIKKREMSEMDKELKINWSSSW